MTAENDAQPDRTEAFMARAMADWGDAVYRLALSQTRSKADAEDVYQDVFMRLYGDATEFTSSEHLKAWLLRVTLRCCIDLRRSAWWKRTAPMEAAADTAALENETDDSLWQAVRALPDELRTVVWLFYVEGCGTDEIAQIVHCRPATVRTRLHRARAKLKTELEGEREDEQVGRNEEHQGLGRAEGAHPQGGA